MAIPTPPPASPVVPVYPALGSSNFNNEAYTYATTMPSVVIRIKEIADNAYDNASEAYLGAQITTSSSLIAAASAGLSMGSANFKGNWSSLTGPLNIPASVRHATKYWLLLSNLADVTLKTPGVDAEWVEMNTSADEILTSVISTNTTAVPNTRYIVAAAGITITLPADASWAKGAYFGVREVIATGTYSIAFGDVKVRGVSYATESITAALNGVDLTYEDSTRGLV